VADQVMPDFFDTYTHFTYKLPKAKIAYPVPNQWLFRITVGMSARLALGSSAIANSK
jgi:hypothetical protein